MAQETAFLAALQGVARIEFRGQVLELQDRNGGLVVALRAAVAVAPVASPSGQRGRSLGGPVRSRRSRRRRRARVRARARARPRRRARHPRRARRPTPVPPTAAPTAVASASTPPTASCVISAPGALATGHDGLPRELVHRHDPGRTSRAATSIRHRSPSRRTRRRSSRAIQVTIDPADHVRRVRWRRDEPDRLERAGQRAGDGCRSAGEPASRPPRRPAARASRRGPPAMATSSTWALGSAWIQTSRDRRQPRLHLEHAGGRPDGRPVVDRAP